MRQVQPPWTFETHDSAGELVIVTMLAEGR